MIHVYSFVRYSYLCLFAFEIVCGRQQNILLILTKNSELKDMLTFLKKVWAQERKGTNGLRFIPKVYTCITLVSKVTHVEYNPPLFPLRTP